MFNDRFSEITQKPNPPFINAFAVQGDLVRTAESFSLTAIVADNGIPLGLNALLTEGERVKRFGFLQSELDRAKANHARALVAARSTSETIDLALDRLIGVERLRRDIAAYQRIPPTAPEATTALLADTSSLADETDWEALYPEVENSQ